MAKIKLPKNPDGMVTFWIQLRTYWNFSSQANPAREVELEVIPNSMKTDVLCQLKTQSYMLQAFLRGFTLSFSKMLENLVTG